MIKYAIAGRKMKNDIFHNGIRSTGNSLSWSWDSVWKIGKETVLLIYNGLNINWKGENTKIQAIGIVTAHKFDNTIKSRSPRIKL